MQFLTLSSVIIYVAKKKILTPKAKVPRLAPRTGISKRTQKLFSSWILSNSLNEKA